MFFEPNPARLKRLNLAGFELGMQVIFCPLCDFQYPPQTVGQSTCPDCGTYLHVSTVDVELQALVRSYLLRHLKP
jgi:hypothetical protein